MRRPVPAQSDLSYGRTLLSSYQPYVMHDVPVEQRQYWYHRIVYSLTNRALQSAQHCRLVGKHQVEDLIDRRRVRVFVDRAQNLQVT